MPLLFTKSLQKHAILWALTAVILTSALALGTPNSASAHEAEIDGTIGALLHISPDDNPTAGHSSTYELFFNDTAGKFSLANCNCGATIQQNGKTLATRQLSLSGALESTNSYTFPSVGSYTILVTGTPKTAGAFQPFTLTYPVTVNPNPNDTSMAIPPIVWVVLAALIVGVILAAVKTNLA